MTKIYSTGVVVEELGELGRLPDGGIINAGGVAGPNFTVGGKNVLLDESGSVGGATVYGYEHVQLVATGTWAITHAKNSKRIQVTIWDDTDEVVYADVVKIVDLNSIEIRFNTPITGRAILVIF